MTYLIVFLRIISIMILLLICTLFIMGKRPIGELPVFDLLTIVVLGAIAGADIADPKIEHLPTAFAIIILSLFQKFISKVSLKNQKLRNIITFQPTIVIENGNFNYKNIKKIHYPVEDILMLLREKEIFDINEIQYGIIEPTGNISIMKKSQFKYITLKDMNLPYPKTSLPITIVIDGILQVENITKHSLSKSKILEDLKNYGYKDIKEIFFAYINTEGQISINTYN